MIALWKLKYIGKPKIKYYRINNDILRVVIGRKYTIVYCDSFVLFNNVRTDINFKEWWENYLKKKGKKNVVRLRRSEADLLLYGKVMNKRLSKKELSIWKRL